MHKELNVDGGVLEIVNGSQSRDGTDVDHK